MKSDNQYFLYYKSNYYGSDEGYEGWFDLFEVSDFKITSNAELVLTFYSGETLCVVSEYAKPLYNLMNEYIKGINKDRHGVLNFQEHIHPYINDYPDKSLNRHLYR